ncbi:MFS transporter [Janthinobacterium sp. SUN100]|uniref:MFS transporter n=1 Tax=Janthinobacterium sp. SUN100 TaxID=3004101 RepID=UPI0025B06CDE|nr:MFS transporter [Janthinobacterium sp. SUN100]MDN2700465.1 MFS transporter [Janthinobacterium sp. SUN100]
MTTDIKASMLPTTLQQNALTLAAVCLASLMFGLEISSVPVILPTLETVLHGDFKDLQWIMNAYTLACTTVLMATGTLADRYGRKRLLLASLALFGLSSLACGWAGGTGVLIAARALQGMAGGAMLICQVAVLSQQFPAGAARGRAFGAWGIVFGLGLGFGPIIGAAIVALSNWQWVFLVHGPLALAALLLVALGVSESRDPQQRRLDVAGIATLSLAVFSLAWCLTQGPALGFDDPRALASLAVALAGFAAFAVIERRQAAPMVDFSVFRIRRFSGALLGSAGMNCSFWPFMIYLPLYVQYGLGYSSLDTGLTLLAYTLPTLLVPPLAERLALRYRADAVIPAGLLAIGTGLLLMLWGSRADAASWLTILPGCLLAGTGLGLTNTPVTNTTTAAVPGERAGMASSIDISARMVSLSINIALMGFILVAAIESALRRHVPAGIDGAALRALAEAVSAGKGGALPAGVAKLALAQGFGAVMLYGGVAACLFAVASWLVFGVGRAGAPRLGRL